MDPCYIAAFEHRGFKLNGDDLAGDKGHYANAIHPLFPDTVKQNARFCFKTKEIIKCNMVIRYNDSERHR